MAQVAGMNCRVALLVGSMATSLWAQETVCDLFQDLKAADGRQLILTDELLITKDVAVLGAADCDNEFITRVDKQVSLGWPTAVHLRPSSALPDQQLEQFRNAATEADSLRKAGKTLRVSASFAGRLRVTAANQATEDLAIQSVQNRKGANEFPAELTFDSFKDLVVEVLPDPQVLPVISICELFQNLAAWQGKRMAVRGETVSSPSERGWMTGSCQGAFYTGGYRWPVGLAITEPKYYAHSIDALSMFKLSQAPVKGADQLRSRYNVTRTATYVGRLRMRRKYTASCREDGRYITNGFSHGAAAEIILEEVRDIELTPRLLEGDTDSDGNTCEPPDHKTLCSGAKTLLRAVTLNCIDRTAELLSKEGIDSKDGHESASLAAAIRLGREGIVRKLIDAGATVNPPPGEGIRQPLAEAAFSKRIEIMKMLLKAGARVDALDGRGNTYLASYGFFDTRVETLLLDAGANLNARDDEGRTALMHASGFGYAEAVRLLIEHGANLNLKDNNGRTALMHAAAGLYIDAIPELLRNGADLHARDLDGKTALDIARTAGHEVAVRLLTGDN